MDREPVIKGLNEVFRMGYLANRGKEKYGSFSFYANCLEHACCNLTNEQLEALDKRLIDLGMSEYDYFFTNPYGGFSENSIVQAKDEIFDFLRRTGLKVDVETVKQELKSNQYRVAMYFSEAYTTGKGTKDVHFILQERDGSWSSKEGGGEVEFMPTLENILPFRNSNRYVLHNKLIITNPYAKIEENPKQIIVPQTGKIDKAEFCR